MLANEQHRANIEKAFVVYLESDSFSGHVYPGHFYDFCRSRSVFKNINNTLCNRVQLSVQDLAMRANLSFRKTAPPEKTLKKVKYFLAIGLESVSEGGDVNSNLRQKLGDNYGDFGRYIPVRTMKYLYDIEFCADDLPALARDDYKKFFKKMLDEKFTKSSEYIEHMKNGAIPLEMRETVDTDQPGFLYCFVSSFKAQNKGYCVVKVGRTKNAIERVLSHKLIMIQHQIVYLAHSLNSLSNEKKLIEYFEKSSLSRAFYDPKTRRKSPEMFELPALYVPKMFDDFIAALHDS